MAKFKSNKMTQCKLASDKTENSIYTIGWIESCYAQIGNILEDEDGEIWHVVGKYQTVDTQYVIDHERDYTKQRAGSDI